MEREGGLKVQPGNDHHGRGRVRQLSHGKAKGDAGRVLGMHSLLLFLASVSGPEKSHMQPLLSLAATSEEL